MDQLTYNRHCEYNLVKSSREMSILYLDKWFQQEKVSLLSEVYLRSEHSEHFKRLLDQQRKKSTLYLYNLVPTSPFPVTLKPVANFSRRREGGRGLEEMELYKLRQCEAWRRRALLWSLPSFLLFLIFALWSLKSNQFSCFHFLATLQMCRTSRPQHGDLGRESRTTLEGGETGGIAGRGDWRCKGNMGIWGGGYRKTVTVREDRGGSGGCYRFCRFCCPQNPLLWHVKGMWRCKTTGINK